MPVIEQLGMQAASEAVNSIMGIMMGAYNDDRQLAQQAKLNELNKGMIDYNYQKQLEMWKNTNYSAQVAELKKANLNPGLIYGMSGGGGTTTGTGGGSQAAHAPVGGGEMQAAQQMGIQYQLLQAQKENIEANTAQTKVQTAKTAGVDTQKTVGEIQNLAAGVENTKANTAYTKAQQQLTEIKTDLESLDYSNKAEMANDMKATIRYGMRKVYAEMESAEVTANVDKSTQETKINQAKQQLALTVIDQWLKKAEILGISQEVQLGIQQLKLRWSADAREWDKMVQTNQGLRNQGEKLDYDTAIPAELKEILDNIFIVPSLGPSPKRNPIGFK